MSDLDRCSTEVIKVNDRKEARSKSWCSFKTVVSFGSVCYEKVVGTTVWLTVLYSKVTYGYMNINPIASKV